LHINKSSHIDTIVIMMYLSSELGNRRYQTLPAVCSRTINSIYFLNLHYC